MVGVNEKAITMEFKNWVLWFGVFCVFLALYGFVNMLLLHQIIWSKLIGFGSLGFVLSATLYAKIK